VHLFATETSNTVDLISNFVLFYLTTVRHVKFLRNDCVGVVQKFEGKRPY
jgi:hypothetical protein